MNILHALQHVVVTWGGRDAGQAQRTGQRGHRRVSTGESARSPNAVLHGQRIYGGPRCSACRPRRRSRIRLRICAQHDHDKRRRCQAATSRPARAGGRGFSRTFPAVSSLNCLHGRVKPGSARAGRVASSAVGTRESTRAASLRLGTYTCALPATGGPPARTNYSASPADLATAPCAHRSGRRRDAQGCPRRPRAPGLSRTADSPAGYPRE